jgi:hypothetical protein
MPKKMKDSKSETDLYADQMQKKMAPKPYTKKGSLKTKKSKK